MRSLAVIRILLGVVLFAGMARTQDVTPEAGEITLKVELRQGETWQPVDIHRVFRNKDVIRFIFSSSFPGYLLVVNHSSDGPMNSLFPRPDTKQLGQVEANKEYTIPGNKAWFVVGGKPGFDVTEWVVSSTPLERDWESVIGGPEPVNTMLPKCPREDSAAKASCVDKRAGPAQAPAPTGDDAPLISRDLSFGSRELSALITVPDKSRKLVVYEFRVAHR